MRGEAKMKIWKTLLIVLTIAVVAGVYFFMLQPKGAAGEAVCGDNICSANESCWNCGLDCSCNSNEFCSNQEKKCVKTVCGNNVCEPFESSDNCCTDCKCLAAGEVCNSESKKCELQKFNVSDEQAKSIAENYIDTQNQTTTNSQNLGYGTYYGELIKIVMIETNDSIEYVGITESGNAV